MIKNRFIEVDEAVKGGVAFLIVLPSSMYLICTESRFV